VIFLKNILSSIVKGNRLSESSPSASAEQQNFRIQLTGKCGDNIITDNIIVSYSKIADGDNLEMNSVERNISPKSIP
jgi:hypothetical protein